MSDNDLEGQDQEIEQESEAGEFEDQVPPEEMQIQILHNKIRNGLKVMGKTVEGNGWAFTKLECEGQNIRELYEILIGYPYLREINFSRNKIVDYSSMTSIRFLTHLNLRENMVSSFEHFAVKGQLEFLEELNLTDNNLKSLDHFELKNLKKLILDKNNIATAENFKGHPSLQQLSMVKNKMTTMEHLISMPALTQLVLTDNPITKFEGLKNTNHLKEIILKNSQIESFELESLPDLPYINNINIEECKKFANLKAIDALQKYENSLNIINVTGTQLQEEIGDSVKKEILMKLPKLKSINEEPVETEEVEAALQEKKEREEEEARRLAEEEEARRQAEEEAAAQNKNPEEEEED